MYDSIQFQRRAREISHCGLRSPKYVELNCSTLLFAGDGKEMQQDSKRTYRAIVLLIKPFVWLCSRHRRRRGLLKLPYDYLIPLTKTVDPRSKLTLNDVNARRQSEQGIHFGVGKMTQFDGGSCVCAVIDTHIDHGIVRHPCTWRECWKPTFFATQLYLTTRPCGYEKLHSYTVS